ncbi:hypothetical protein ERJ75_000168300 [Trypanosoma vivax]|nr:hypothetical protein ERJ75_000168300 [Trypanosoma vivax]
MHTATVQLQLSHGTGASQVEARHHRPAAEAKQASEQHGVLSTGDAHEHTTTVKRKMKDGTVARTLLLQRSLQCPYCPMKCALKQYLTMHLQAKHDQPRREAVHNSLKVDCRESSAHLLECRSLRELRKKHGLGTLKGGELFFSAQLASFLKELFRLESPSANTPDEPESDTCSSREEASLAHCGGDADWGVH